MSVFFTPGPIYIKKNIEDAFISTTISHRSGEFKAMLGDTKNMLCRLVNAEHVDVFMGSGTLANDIVAGQLACLQQKGLILSNGEFGERLLKHAEGFALNYAKLEYAWGMRFSREEIIDILDKENDIKWVWCVHCETSTGMLNDIHSLQEICLQRNIRLCLDCISSLGCVPLDLKDVYLASATSHKGVGSYSGLALVFSNGLEIESKENRLPRYLDLSEYSISKGVPYTMSSNLLAALYESLKSTDFNAKYYELKLLAEYVKETLIKNKVKIFLPDKNDCVNVITICLPHHFDSLRAGQVLKNEGFLLNYGSDYLMKKNWLQICIMHSLDLSEVDSMLAALIGMLKNTSTADSENQCELVYK